jgi:hypothetical protein
VTSFRRAAWVALGLLVCGAVPAAARGDTAPKPAVGLSGQTAAQDPLTVLAQSPWVVSGQNFQLRLQVGAGDPPTDKLSVQVFNRLTTRSDFDSAASGRVGGTVRYSPQVVPVSQLPADPQGGVDITIPVSPSQPSAPSPWPAFNAVGGSGVFPLQVTLYDANGVPLGKPLTTFLVYASGDPSATGFPRLSVAVVVPVKASPNVGAQGQLQPVSQSDSSRLSKLAGALGGHADVAVSLAASPQTLDALAAGTPSDKATLTAIASLAHSSDQVLPEPYAPVSLDDMFSAGLGAEVGQQMGAGESTLAKVFGLQPSTGVWVLNGQVDGAALSALSGLGMTRLVVPDADLSPLPLSSRQTTFALPTRLAPPDKSGTQLNVYASDPALTADFTGSGGSVLAATRLLAELSMIQVETPGVTRGVSVVPPARWEADPTFMETLLAGLSGHPLLQSVTVSGLFQQVKSSSQVERSLTNPGTSGPQPGGANGGSGSGAAGGSGVSGSGLSSGSGSSGSGSSGAGSSGSASGGAGAGAGAGSGSSGAGSAGGQTPVGSAQSGDLSAGIPAADVLNIKRQRQAVDALQALMPADQPGVAAFVATVQDQLLVAESNEILEPQRQALIAAVNREANRELSSVTLPGSSSITLTATRGQIPLTILAAGGTRAKVELRLSSQRLIFRPFDPGNGHCDVPTPTSEICQLVLAGQNTTLKVPVETRSSGVFPLDVSLWTPGGAHRLALNRDTVRSTAVSNVGVILIVLAVASLAIWWGRDLRHGRRARKLVPPQVFEEPYLSDDPIVREFFDNPPPGYPKHGDSPAQPRT